MNFGSRCGSTTFSTCPINSLLPSSTPTQFGTASCYLLTTSRGLCTLFSRGGRGPCSRTSQEPRIPPPQQRSLSCTRPPRSASPLGAPPTAGEATPPAPSFLALGRRRSLLPTGSASLWAPAVSELRLLPVRGRSWRFPRIIPSLCSRTPEQGSVAPYLRPAAAACVTATVLRLQKLRQPGVQPLRCADREQEIWAASPRPIRAPFRIPAPLSRLLRG